MEDPIKDSNQPPKEPVDYHIGIDYEKVRKIIREEIREAITDLLRVSADVIKEHSL